MRPFLRSAKVIPRGCRRGLQDAFRALAAREDNVIGADGAGVSPATRRRMLAKVCAALSDAEDIMPSGACAELDLLPGSTYAEGAARALTTIAEAV